MLVPGLGGEFMPQLEEGNLWIRAIMPRTTSLEEAARIAPRIRAVIAATPEVRGVMSQVGRPDDGTDVTSFFNLEFNVPLEADGAVAKAHANDIRLPDQLLLEGPTTCWPGRSPARRSRTI